MGLDRKIEPDLITFFRKLKLVPRVRSEAYNVEAMTSKIQQERSLNITLYYSGLGKIYLFTYCFTLHWFLAVYSSETKYFLCLLIIS